MLFMPDPILTWISSAPWSKVTRRRRPEGPRSRTLPKNKNHYFLFDSPFVTFFEHVLTFYQHTSGHIGS
jgi:hypothetical protein